MEKKKRFKSDKIISDVLNHFLNRMEINKIKAYMSGSELNGLYPAINVEKIEQLPVQEEGFVYIKCVGEKNLKEIAIWAQSHYEKNDIIIYTDEKNRLAESLPGKVALPLSYIGSNGFLYLLGKTFEGPKQFDSVPIDFKILAIVHIYNEADIAELLCEYILEQGIDVYFLDNWSTDGTYERLLHLKESYPERINVERFPRSGKTENFELYMQCEKTEEISKSMNYNWYIHWDADEMRVSPWANTTLKQSIYYIDSLGYNLIEFQCIDFRLTNERQENIFMRDVYFEFGSRPTHYSVKAWRKTDSIELKASGGHWAKVDCPRVFPLLMLNRHYPFRTVEQAQKKVFQDRKPRFGKEKKKYGWHGHYDSIIEKSDYIKNKEELFLWDNNTFCNYYIPLFCKCGISMINGEILIENRPLEVENLTLAIYGAGKTGKMIYQKYVVNNRIAAWVDKNYTDFGWIFCEKINSPKYIGDVDFDYILIAIAKKDLANEVRKYIENMGINSKKIIWTCPRIE